MTTSRAAWVLALGALLASGAAARHAGKPPPKAEIKAAKQVEVPFFDPESGKRVALLRAAKVTPDPADSQNLHCTTVRILFFQEEQTHVATGRTGTINMNQKTAFLKGNVVVVFEDAKAVEDRTHVYTDDLYWDGKTGTATTEGPVRIERPDLTITGRGMTVLRHAGREPAEGKADRRGRILIHRHDQTVIRPDKSQWLVPPPPAEAPRPAREAPAPKAKDAPEAQEPAPPIVITCKDPLTIDRAAGTATYEKDVRAVQGTQTLTCDLLIVGFAPGGDTATQATLRAVTAEGHVRIDDGATLAFADRAVWRREEGALVLIGRPAEVRWDNGNRIVAGSIQRLANGEILHCTTTEEHPANVFLLIHAARAAPASRPPGNTEDAPEAPPGPASSHAPVPPGRGAARPAPPAVVRP